MNTSISYMYRDGSNNKYAIDLVLAGSLTEREVAEIRATLDEGEYFLAHPVDLPCLQRDRGSRGELFGNPPRDFPIPDVDHPWHSELGIGATAKRPNYHLTAAQLLGNFRAIVEWDEFAEMDFLGIKWRTDVDP